MQKKIKYAFKISFQKSYLFIFLKNKIRLKSSSGTKTVICPGYHLCYEEFSFEFSGHLNRLSLYFKGFYMLFIYSCFIFLL